MGPITLAMALMGSAVTAQAPPAAPAAGDGVVACRAQPGRANANKVSFHNIANGRKVDAVSIAAAYVEWLEKAPEAQKPLGANGIDPTIAILKGSCAWFADQTAAFDNIKQSVAEMRGRGYATVATEWTPSTDPATPGIVVCAASDAMRKLYFYGRVDAPRGQLDAMAIAYPKWLRANAATAAQLSAATAGAPDLTTACDFYEVQYRAGGAMFDAAAARRDEGYTATETQWKGVATP